MSQAKNFPLPAKGKKGKRGPRTKKQRVALRKRQERMKREGME